MQECYSGCKVTKNKCLNQPKSSLPRHFLSMLARREATSDALCMKI